MNKIIKNKAGVSSATISIVLMAVITVAIAATIFVFVIQSDNVGETEYVYKIGIFRGYCDVFGDGSRIIINDEPLKVQSVDVEYLLCFLGQNITLVLEPFDGGQYDYTYIGAYLNLGDVKNE